MPSPSSARERHTGDPGIFEDPDRMRAVLGARLLPGDGRSLQIIECRIANLRQRDGSRGTVQYDVLIEDAATGKTHAQIITGLMYGRERTRRVWDIIRAAQDARSEALAGAMLQPFAYAPELDMLLQVFPHDHRLPALASLMTTPPADLVAPLLLEFGPGSWQPRAWEPTVIQYRADMRAIVQVDFTAQDAESDRVAARRFFAKVYRDGEQAAHAFDAQRALHGATLRAGTDLVVAKPVHFAADERLLITAALPGSSLSRIIRGGKGAEPAVRAAARAVAALHQLEVSAPERHIAGEISQLREAEAHLAAARPDLAGAVSEMVEIVAKGLAGAPSTLIHGDLKPDHILVDGDRVSLIDFDLMARADPMTDVAHLVAFFAVPQERARQRDRDAALAVDHFLDEYFQHAPASWSPRLRLHHALTSIHKAVGMSRRRGTGRGARVDDVLKEGQALLAGSVEDGAAPSFKRRITRASTN